MPTILTKVIDTIHRNKNKFFEEYGEVKFHDIFNHVVNQSLSNISFKGKTYLFFFQLTQEGIEAEKKAISFLSKLRNEIQTDKPILILTDGLRDVDSWNQYLQRHQSLQGDPEFVSWFKSPWLYVECYMYRRIHEALLLK